MNILEMIKPSQIDLEMKAGTKDEVIHHLTHMLYENDKISSEKKFYDNVFYRESVGETGMGNYIAIPHGESDAVKEVSVAIGRVIEPVEWESLDDLPVRLIFMLAVPIENKNNVHIKMLSQLASILTYEDIQNELMNSVSKEDFINCFFKHFNQYASENNN